MRRMFSKNQLENQVINLLESGNIPSVKADEIIENMEGYSFSDLQGDHAWTPIYAGVCKNGNKVTFVIFGSIVFDGTETGNADLATFTLPASVLDKLYPYSIGGLNNVLDNKKIYLQPAAYVIDELPMVIIKSTSSITFRLGKMQDIQSGTGTYLFRIEETFLLSDNLID